MTDTIKQIFFPILTAILGSGTTFLFFKQHKSKANTDAFAEFPKIVNDFVETIRNQNETFSKMITEQNAINNELKRDIQKQDLRIAELERVNRGLQNRINEYEKRTYFSEEHVCLNTECEIRKPKIGTFKGKMNDI